MQQYMNVLRKYADFSGRAARKEFWMFQLVNFVIYFVLGFLSGMFTTGGSNTLAMVLSVISLVYSLAVLVPSLAVTVRRLHDVGRSGWFIFIALIPIAGALALLITTIKKSESGENAYGPNPYDALPAASLK